MSMTPTKNTSSTPRAENETLAKRDLRWVMVLNPKYSIRLSTATHTSSPKPRRAYSE